MVLREFHSALAGIYNHLNRGVLTKIVVSDNCSSDETAAIATNFEVKDPRVRYERSEVF